MAELRNSREDALVAACAAAWRRMGVRIMAPPADPTWGSESDTRLALERLCECNGLRARRLQLDGEWWRGDCGPLVGFAAADNAPLAIVRTIWGSSQAVPTDGAPWTIDARSADRIAPDAYSFHRRLAPGSFLWQLQLAALRRVAIDVALVIVLGLASALTSLALPFAVALCVMWVLPQGDAGLAAQAVGILAAACVFTALLWLAQSKAVRRVRSETDAALHAALFDRLLSLPAALRRGVRAIDLASECVRAATLRSHMVSCAAQAVSSFLFLLCAVGLLLLMNWRFACVALALIALHTIAAGALARRLPLARSAIEESGARQRRMMSWITHGIEKIRSTGTEDFFFESWRRDFDDERRGEAAERRLMAALAGLAACAPLVGCGATMWWAASSHPHPSLGGLLVMNTALVMSLAALSSTVTALAKVWGSVPPQDALRPLARATTTEPPRNAKAGEEGRRSAGADNRTHVEPWAVQMKGVSFSYHADAAPVVSDVSLAFEAGRISVLRGPSGSGKSTLARILMGLDSPTKGELSVNGAPMRAIPSHLFRRRVAGIVQGARLPPGTILSTIAGSSDITIDEAWEAARKAACLADIERMPAQMLTRVSAGGMTLSDGQRQRVLLASLFARNPAPSLIILDEALNAIDPRSRQTILENLRGLGATIVCVSHQPDILDKADHVFDIKDGRILAQSVERK